MTRDLQDAVKAKVAEGNPGVFTTVVEELASELIRDRKLLVIAAVKKHQETEKELRKIKPDNVAYDADGNVTSSTFSSAANEKRKKAQETLAKIDKALLAAKDQADYDPLKKLTETQSA